MKFEETLNTNEQQKSLDQTQEAVAVPQSQEELLETKIENVEKIADQVDDISPAEIAQIEKLGGDESELAKELTPIDEEIKRTKSGFIDRAKNYVVSLATMVASVGNMSGANTDQKVKDKAEANVVYVDNKNDLRLKAYQDSSALYNNYIELKSKLKSQNYEKKKQAFYNSPEEALADKAKHDKEHIDGVNPIPTKVTKKTETLKSVNDFIGGVVNPTLPEQLFSDSIKPSGMEQYDHNDGIGTMQRIFGNVNDKQEFLKNKAYGDTRIIANYSNVKPKVEVKLRQVPEVKTVDKKVLVPEKKPNKSESKIIYVEDKNDPRLKAYQDSINTYVNYNKYIDEIKEVAKKYKISNDKKNPSYVSATEADKINSELQKIDKKYKTYGKMLFKENLLKYDNNSPTLLAFGTGPSMSYTYDKYDAVKPLVEVKYKPKPKLTETKLNPKDVLHIPLEKTEVDLFANLKQKEIVKAPEKTGYTVRVGEKLFYLSKEDVNKLEADKTTFYNSSEQGNGAEQHLVWRGNEQGQTLQQVAERLGIKLPIAFDTQEQKFENE